MEVEHCSKTDNITKALSMAEKAVSSGADLIVLPEVFSTGFCYEGISDLAEEAPFPTISKFIGFSKIKECAVIGSIIEAQFQEGIPVFYNMCFCVEHGKLAGIYRKCHLFRQEKTILQLEVACIPYSLKATV